MNLALLLTNTTTINSCSISTLNDEQSQRVNRALLAINQRYQTLTDSELIIPITPCTAPCQHRAIDTVTFPVFVAKYEALLIHVNTLLGPNIPTVYRLRNTTVLPRIVSGYNLSSISVPRRCDLDVSPNFQYFTDRAQASFSDDGPNAIDVVRLTNGFLIRQQPVATVAVTPAPDLPLAQPTVQLVSNETGSTQTTSVSAIDAYNRRHAARQQLELDNNFSIRNEPDRDAAAEMGDLPDLIDDEGAVANFDYSILTPFEEEEGRNAAYPPARPPSPIAVRRTVPELIADAQLDMIQEHPYRREDLADRLDDIIYEEDHMVREFDLSIDGMNAVNRAYSLLTEGGYSHDIPGIPTDPDVVERFCIRNGYLCTLWTNHPLIRRNNNFDTEVSYRRPAPIRSMYADFCLLDEINRTVTQFFPEQPNPMILAEPYFIFFIANIALDFEDHVIVLPPPRYIYSQEQLSQRCDFMFHLVSFYRDGRIPSLLCPALTYVLSHALVPFLSFVDPDNRSFYPYDIHEQCLNVSTAVRAFRRFGHIVDDHILVFLTNTVSHWTNSPFEGYPIPTAEETPRMFENFLIDMSHEGLPRSIVDMLVGAIVRRMMA